MKYIGPPPGTAALLEIKEAEEQRIREIEAARKSAEEDAGLPGWSLQRDSIFA